MDLKIVIVALGAAAIGLVGGFLIANSINRTELSALKAEAEQRKNTTTNTNADPSLTAAEISNTIAQADQSPGDFGIQQKVGVSLYLYAAAKQDPVLLKETIRILERAVKLRPTDQGVTRTLGNAHFDVGYITKDNASLKLARDYYARTLLSKPDDVDVQTDLALTYFLETPPDLDRSVNEFRKSLAKNPKHEKTLEFITQALARQNKYPEAVQYLEQLRAVNPSNSSLQGLTAMLANQQPAG